MKYEHEPESAWKRGGGVVVLHAVDAHAFGMEHERASHTAIARQLAALKDGEFVDRDLNELAGQSVYLVPSDTLVGIAAARALGVQDEDDVFGGVVPHAFVATKAISHPLVEPGTAQPVGWSHGFSIRTEGSVLRGYSAFRIEDAFQGGRRLLTLGPVRLKPTRETGGRGQIVVASIDELNVALASLDPEEVARQGLVLEQHLGEVTTRSVGQVRIAGLVASYHGTQELTQDNAGAEVYGGSTLTVVRGGFDALLALEVAPEIRCAIAQARAYDTAVGAEYPEFFASRRNYDVAQGINALGQWRSGVLEQSWRIGGASGAEVLALAAFKLDPALQLVRASTVERYGTGKDPPAHATVLYDGDDPDVGSITKYALIETHGDT